MLVAPPIGGALYNHLGFRAPFIFGIIFTAIDFVGRLFVIERKEALKWGHDPAIPLQPPDNTGDHAQSSEGVITFENSGARGATFILPF